VASGPRNHLYRTGHRVIESGSFCFVFNAEFDHSRDLAYNLHLQSNFRRANRNALDQATEDLESLITVPIVRASVGLLWTLAALCRSVLSIFSKESAGLSPCR
jgi:hypothetical protein